MTTGETIFRANQLHLIEREAKEIKSANPEMSLEDIRIEATQSVKRKTVMSGCYCIITDLGGRVQSQSAGEHIIFAIDNDKYILTLTPYTE